MNTSQNVKKELNKLANQEKAKIMQRFFKTGKGQYGEGDIFIGLKVPEQREIAKKYINLNLNEIEKLLKSEIHEYRLTALLILTYQFPESKQKEKIINFYLKNTKYINNWDLVDLSADKILGEYLINKNKDILYKLAKSNNLWEKRTAIISCFNFIKNNQFDDALKISEILLNDEHDLIHKAVGWMLREIGKRNIKEEEVFLKKHYKQMPRTMLRYSIERFPDKKRKFYMQKKQLK